MRTLAPLSVWLLLALADPVATWSQDVALSTDRLPPGWNAEPKMDVAAAEREQIAARLGVPITGVSRQRLSVRGRGASVNVIRCPDEKTATRLYGSLAGFRGSGFLSRKGEEVVEYANCDVIMAKKVRDLYGLTPEGERLWEARMTLGCVDQVDPAMANQVWILFLKGGEELPIRARCQDFRFGTSVKLWTGKRPWFRGEYSFAPVAAKQEESDGMTMFSFREPPRQCGIPCVEVKAEIRVRNAYRPGGDRPAGDLCAATPRWPTAKVRELAERLTAKAKTAPEKLEAILAFVSAELRFDGPVQGSRYGVEKVLAQKTGHCWDMSDVFVTLCRASGIPARQIAGWVAPLQAGHVWAEIYLDGQGWLPVDATVPWAGTSDDYVPWFSTSDGEMPFLYLSMPALRLKE